MKNKIIIMVLICSINTFAQSFMTNTIELVHFKRPKDFIGYMMQISYLYDVRFCIEKQHSDSRKPLTREENDQMTYYWYIMPTAFTNAPFEHVFGTVMNMTTNHVWRYDNNTDTIYIYPETNSVSMIKIGPVAITNAPPMHFHNRDDMLGLKQYGFKHSYGRMDQNLFQNVKINLDFEEAFVWEVLDMICAQMPNKTSWIIDEGYDTEKRKVYWFGFYDKNTLK